MKKSILIFCTVFTSISLMAFGYINWNHSTTNSKETSCNKTLIDHKDLSKTVFSEPVIDLVYKIDSRFIARITKESLINAKSIIDIVPEEATSYRKSYQNSRISILHEHSETTEVGTSDVLNLAQRKLLQSTNYSNNIRVTSICKKISGTGNLIDDSLVYYITIIPEKEAAYESGQQALIDYLRENSRKETAGITKDKLQPGKVLFTVTKDGTISNVKLSSTSGYDTVDNTLVDLVRSIPGSWIPATNGQGQAVDQELVFFFGLQGC